MKKRIGLTVLLSASLLALGACGESIASETDGSAEAATGAESTVAGEAEAASSEQASTTASKTRPKAATPQTGARTVDCELVVEGDTYIDSECEFSPMGDGDFQISGDDYFAQVDVESKGKAQGFWNGSKGASHAQGPLGSLQLKGGCWVGAKAKICAKNLSDKAHAQRAAARPDGMMLYPDVAGASSSCLSLKGGARVGSKLVLHSCEIPDDLVFVKKADGALGIYGHPDLCLGFGENLTVTKCNQYAAVWETRATSTRSAVVSTSDGGCMAIPDFEDPDARFPFSVHQIDCAEESLTVKFFMSKD